MTDHAHRPDSAGQSGQPPGPPRTDQVRTVRADPARTYGALLAGDSTEPDDDELARQVTAANPATQISVTANREFVIRSAEWIAAHTGVDQFLDLGSGLPQPPSLHEAVQRIDARARVVYADNSPYVLARAGELDRGTHEGRVVLMPGDLREPEQILASPALTRTLDLSRPVAVSASAVFHFIPDEERSPGDIIRHLMDAVPSGSYLVCTNATADFSPEVMAAAADAFRRSGLTPVLRTRAEFARFFAGLELTGPGIVPVQRWRPPALPAPRDEDVNIYAGVAVKP